MPDSAPSLPEVIGEFKRAAPSRTITPDTIFEYMNGGGELYLAYRFDHMSLYEYRTVNGDEPDEIFVEVYAMASPHDAFGLLSLDWGGEPVILTAGRSESPAPLQVPPHTALYGFGLLRMWTGNRYIRILAPVESDSSKAAVIALGRLLAKEGPSPVYPDLLLSLPQRLSSERRIRTDRTAYFRSHLVLNSQFYVSHSNLLNLGLDTEVVIAPYDAGTSTGRVQVMRIRYPDAVACREAAVNFVKIYLPEHTTDSAAVATAPTTGMAGDPILQATEEGWVGLLTRQADLILVFQAESQTSVNAILVKLAADNAAKGGQP